MNLDFVKNHKTFFLIFAALLVLAGTFSAGRYSAPESIKEVTKVETQEKIVYQDRIVTRTVDRIVYVQKENKNIQTETTVVKASDGTETTRTVVVDRTTTDTASSRMVENTTTEEKKTSVDLKTDSETQKIISNAKPQWKLSVRVEGGVLLLRPIVPIVDVGVSAERRIIGPFFMGISVSTGLGVNLSGFTGPYAVKGGIVLGGEF